MTADTDSHSTPNSSFTVHHQSVFVFDSNSGSESGSSSSSEASSDTVDEHGLLALDDEPFETTLFDHGVDVDTRQPTSRLETGGSKEFIDDRPASAIRSGHDQTDSFEAGSGIQGTLSADTALDQRTLNGDQASARFMFEAEQRRKHAHEDIESND
jgi:hypothetical protein